MKRLFAAALVIVASAPCNTVAAQTQITRPIRFIVPYVPGGGTDTLSRLLGPFISDEFGQQVVIDNRAGGSSTIGTLIVARAAPDGHTIGMIDAAFVVNPSLLGKLPYDTLKDFTPAVLVATAPLVLVVHPAVAAKSVRELVALAKSEPGKLNFGSAGNGTAVHLAGEALADAAGFQFTHVPHRGLAPALTAVMGGFVDVVIGAPGVINAQVEAGKLRSIAQFGATRAAALSTVPTLKEQGIDLALRADFGFFAPKGLPADVVLRLNDALQKAIESEEFKTFVAVSLVAPAFLNANDYHAVVDAERAIYARVVPKLALGNR